MTATRLVHKLGENYNQAALQWKLQCSNLHSNPPHNHEIHTASGCKDDDSSRNSQPLTYPQYILVGDNLDKNITPRDMRTEHQVKSIHYFHSYAAHDRIKLPGLSDTPPECNICSLPISTFLPSISDCTALRANYIILAARVIVDKLPHFSSLHDCVTRNIPHLYTKAMQEKSVIVSVHMNSHKKCTVEHGLLVCYSFII